jgi:hypothetical protein
MATDLTRAPSSAPDRITLTLFDAGSRLPRVRGGGSIAMSPTQAPDAPVRYVSKGAVVIQRDPADIWRMTVTMRRSYARWLGFVR